jgi:hypothetical protein
VGLPASGNTQGGGLLTFWLHAGDQVQLPPDPSGGLQCQLRLFGQVISGTVLNLQ